MRRRTPRRFCDVVGCCCSFSFRGFSYPWLFDVILHPFVSYRQVYPYRHLPILYFQLSSSQSDSRHFQFTFLGFSYSEWYGFECLLSMRGLPRRFLGSTLSRHFWHSFVTQMRAGTPRSSSSSMPALIELTFTADARTQTTDITVKVPWYNVLPLCQ